MTQKRYYSSRTTKNPQALALGLLELRRLFHSAYQYFYGEGYFQQHLGFNCVDQGFIAGIIGDDVEAEILLAIRKTEIWPIYDHIDDYKEDDIFDMIEFLFDHVSKPTKREYHSWNDCGWHCTEFDRQAGQEEFKAKLNRILPLYSTGFELSMSGEILNVPASGLESLVQASLPKLDAQNINVRVESAISKFRRSRANIEERRDAIRDLVDVLEFLRPKAKAAIQSEDERDLFNLANNFGLRHHNTKQKTDYDKPIWYSWLFYHYLATIHAVTRLIERETQTPALRKSNPK